MSIFKPSDGEEAYSEAFSAGLNNIDSHDHSGAPDNGVPIGTNGIQDGAITPEKLSQQILQETTAITVGATPVVAASIPVNESSAVTISGRFVGLRDDATESVGGDFLGTFHRPTGGSVLQVFVPLVNVNRDSTGLPTFDLIADTINEAVSLTVTGETAKTYNWVIVYNAIAQPTS
jgi:hypothetical protein